MQEILDFLNHVARETTLRCDGEFLSCQVRQTIASPWHEIAAFDLRTTTGQQWRIACREMRHKIPAHCIDYLSIEDADPKTHLLIVYLCNEGVSSDQLPSSLVLAQHWATVSHIYWGDVHPFVQANSVGTKPGLPDQVAALPMGGKRIRNANEQALATAPLVSIMTVVFNEKDTVEQTIQSVLHQTCDEVEYIIVDGGSRDGTLEVVNRYSQWIDYWCSEQDKGVYDALNHGVSLARGELIGAIHANDLYLPDTVETVVAHARKHPADEFYYGNLIYVTEDRSWKRGKEISHRWQMVMFGDFFHPTCFLRSSVYQRFGAFDLAYPIAADYDFGIRLWNAGVKFSYINASLAYFRLGGISSELYNNQWERHLVRVGNGTNTLVSVAILFLVFSNYYLKRSWRTIKDLCSSLAKQR